MNMLSVESTTFSGVMRYSECNALKQEGRNQYPKGEKISLIFGCRSVRSGRAEIVSSGTLPRFDGAKWSTIKHFKFVNFKMASYNWWNSAPENLNRFIDSGRY